MDEFKPGDRVEVIKSSKGYTIGQQGTVSRLESGLILVKLDRETELANDVTIIDSSSEDVAIDPAFQADELRHVVSPST
jgi:hypothetical protein